MLKNFRTLFFIIIPSLTIICFSIFLYDQSFFKVIAQKVVSGEKKPNKPAPTTTPVPCVECETAAKVQLPLTPLPTRPAEQIRTKAGLWDGGTILRGANLWQALNRKEDVSKWPAANCEANADKRMETYYSDDDFTVLRVWKANYVNISHPAVYSQKPIKVQGSSKKEYRGIPCIFSNLRRLIRMAKANRMFVVVAFRTGPGRSEKQFDKDDKGELINKLFETEKGKLTRDAIEAQAAWVNMWREVALELKHETAVVGYDLMVEPGTEEEDKVSGIQTTNQFLWFDFAKKLAAVIRDPESGGGAGDRVTPILIGGSNYSEACALLCINPADFSSFNPVVFTAHQYQPDNYSRQENGLSSFECGDDGTIKNKDEKIKHEAVKFDDSVKIIVNDHFERMNAYKQQKRVPLAINEYGAFRWAKDGNEFLKYEMDRLERLGVNHALWLWQVNYCIGDDEFNFRHGSDPRNHRPVPAEQNDAFIKEIKDNWEKNTIYATPEILARFAY